MTHAAAFLHDINVGHVNLTMAEMATVLTNTEFANVRTILSSSNVLLQSSLEVAAVRKKAEATLRKQFGCQD
ncbi:DUF1697 domain-containing protein [Mycobacterium leprae]|uniref:DUF1697 domain-containing protein n=1 Tax=Mycobacterium leprae TaxID=1769 RepID=UPI0007DB4927|nr:DUF1697 domain-containing protein [Mycobacterium leprae]OAX70771.1 hypothetical protein A3216_10040 [Mycobacterium leprae 7935681]